MTAVVCIVSLEMTLRSAKMDDQTPAGTVCGPDGCDDTTSPETLNPQAAAGTRIDIVSDAICPWCYIGKRQMERALVTTRRRGAVVLDQLESVSNLIPIWRRRVSIVPSTAPGNLAAPRRRRHSTRGS